MPPKKPKPKAPLSDVVAAYLAELQLERQAKPLAALALMMAAAVEDCPAYAKARGARELRGLLAELAETVARADEVAERRQRRAKDRAWAADSG
jgi:hypothetical protein